MRALKDVLEKMSPAVRVPLRSANDDELRLAHSPGYLALVETEIAAGNRELSTGDTRVSKESERVARYAAGAALAATDLVCRGEAATAFCATRPPGHHATASLGMGFCIYDHAAVAARYAQTAHGLARVAIVDWDVHHGNGTQDIFYSDGSVHYFSTHQSPLYPGTGAATETGEGDGEGATLNVPLRAGSGGEEVGAAFRERWIPAMERFRPELVVISAGFDSRRGDPLGGFKLGDEDFASLTRTVRETVPEGRCVSILEGGYNPPGVARAVRAHLEEMK